MYNKVVLVASAILTVDRPPPALAILAGICEKNNIEYSTFDYNLFLLEKLGMSDLEKVATMFAGQDEIGNENPEVVDHIDKITGYAVDYVLSFNPDLIAITSFSALQIPWTKKFLEKLREKSSVTVIGGGSGISYEQKPSTSAGKILATQGLLDYYVLGEGDIVFDDFLRGTISLGVNSKLDKFENWVPQIDNLNDLVIPTYKKIDVNSYKSNLANKEVEVTITGSRGCVRRCTFCDVGNLWKKFRFRSSDSIVEEIVKHYKEIGCLNYFFSDSLINGSIKQFIDVTNKLVELQSTIPEFKNLKYSGQFIVRPRNQHPEYMFELMSKSGCDHIEIGIESGSEQVRYHMGKKFSNDDIDYHLEMCEKYKIKNHILMFTSYPTETVADHEETLDFYKRNQKYLINDTIIGTNVNSPVVIYRNTPLDAMRDELGITIHNMEYANIANWTTSTNPELTIKERWRRYLELHKVTTDLRYNKGSLDLFQIEMHIMELEKTINFDFVKENFK